MKSSCQCQKASELQANYRDAEAMLSRVKQDWMCWVCGQNGPGCTSPPITARQFGASRLYKSTSMATHQRHIGTPCSPQFLCLCVQTGKTPGTEKNKNKIVWNSIEKNKYKIVWNSLKHKTIIHKIACLYYKTIVTLEFVLWQYKH